MRVGAADVLLDTSRGLSVPSSRAKRGGEGSGVGGRSRHCEASHRSTPSHLRYCSAHRCSRGRARDSLVSEDIQSALCQRPCDQADCAGLRPPRSPVSFHEMRSPQSKGRSSLVVENAFARSEDDANATTAFARHPSCRGVVCVRGGRVYQAYAVVALRPSSGPPPPAPPHRSQALAGGGELNRPASLTSITMNGLS